MKIYASARRQRGDGLHLDRGRLGPDHREDVRARLRPGRGQGPVALVARRECRPALRPFGQLLPHPPRPGLADVGHRHPRSGGRHARRAGRRRRCDGVAPAKDDGLAARRDRHHARRRQIRRRLAHPWRPCRQCRHVPQRRRADPESRIRVGVLPAAEAVQRRASGAPARRRSRCLRRRRGDDPLHTRPYARASGACW